MKVAQVCDRWQLPFALDIKDESDKELHQRSYLHYIADHVPFVAAKCLATEWLLQRAASLLDMDELYSVREYMAGVGVQTLIIQKTFSVSSHVVGEISEDCARHLESIQWDYPVQVKVEDANKSLLEYNNSNHKFLDFPNSSILTVNKAWGKGKGFAGLFATSPRLVVWTDTSISYPITIHGEKYSKFFGVELGTQEDYIRAYNTWLIAQYGYYICAAAVRGKNAVYFCATPFNVPMKIKYFPITENGRGFYFINEPRQQWLFK